MRGRVGANRPRSLTAAVLSIGFGHDGTFKRELKCEIVHVFVAFGYGHLQREL